MSDERRPHPPSPLSRRQLLRAGAAGGALAGLAAGRTLGAAPARQAAEGLDRERLVALCHALLPAELTAAERAGVADGLLQWLRGYREGEFMDHGYGRTRLRETGPSPADRYRDDLAALEAAARDRWGAGVQEVGPERLRELAAEAIERAAPDLDSIPGRPDAPHVAIALLSVYYRSAAATDRAYRMRIGQETCRGLFTDVDGLRPWAPGIVDALREENR